VTIPPIASSAVSLGFEPRALERCFLVADILHEDFAEPLAEYALLGLSTQADPFHVVTTPLLSGQCVTQSTVRQSGHQVLRMRDEIEALSRSMRQRLVPIAFIHRHPRKCDASRTDEEFLRGVFVDQVSTVVSFEEVTAASGPDRPCDCPGMRRLLGHAAGRGGGTAALRGEIGIAFSLIVNRDREHRLYAARRRSCPACDRVEVSDVSARLALDPQRSVSAWDRAALRSQLSVEIAARVHIDRDPRSVEVIR
jgi:hypothetical protein